MNCQYCGAPMIRSKRTGKMYCSEKCWLKNQPQQSGQSDDVMGALRKVYEKLNEIENLCNTINFKISKDKVVEKTRMDIPEESEQDDWEKFNEETSR